MLNYLVNKQLRKRKIATEMFVDLRAAFDMVDKSVLGRVMRERGIRKELIVRVEEALRETRSSVRTRGNIGESFKITRG